MQDFFYQAHKAWKGNLVKAAKENLDFYLYKFEQAIEGMEYRDRGVNFSGMFAFCALCDYYKVEVIIESGTANGQSTEILARYFDPGSSDAGILFAQNTAVATKIISIDNNAYGKLDETRERLSKYTNVEIIEGKTQEILPLIIGEHMSPAKALFIDGPKSLFAMSLIEASFRLNNVLFAAVDDACSKIDSESPYHFMDIHPATVFYTDEDWYLERYKYLDYDESMIENHGVAYAFNIPVDLRLEDWKYYWEGNEERLNEMTKQIIKNFIEFGIIPSDSPLIKTLDIKKLEDVDSKLDQYIATPTGNFEIQPSWHLKKIKKEKEATPISYQIKEGKE